MKNNNAWKNEPRLDFLGNEIIVGDEIVLMNPYYRGLVRGKILKITPKQIKIDITSKSYNQKTTRHSSQVIKIIVENRLKKRKNEN